MTWPDQGATAAGGNGESLGQRAERTSTTACARRCRPSSRPSRTSPGSSATTALEREGEADVIVAHPDRGFLVIEVKSGPITRDSQGRWWAGGRPLDRAPFEQAADSHHSLVAKLRELPDWPAGLDPMSATPSRSRTPRSPASAPRSSSSGTDADPDLIIDRAMLEPDGLRNARLRDVGRRLLRAVVGRRSAVARARRASSMLAAMITSPLELRSLLRSEIKDGNREIVRADRRAAAHPQHAAGRAPGGGRRGSGDRQDHARDRQGAAARRRRGSRPCSSASTRPSRACSRTRPATWRSGPGTCTVSTFHQLAEDLGREAGTLPEKPDPVTDEWFAETLPDGARRGDREARAALPRDRGRRGAGLRCRLAGVARGAALSAGSEDVLYVFHDPAQAIFRADQIGELGLTEYPLDFNCRNARPIHALIEPLALGGLASLARRTDGRRARADQGATSTPRPSRRCARCSIGWSDVEGVVPGSIAVLSGVGLEKSAVWKQRVYGNQVLWNGAVGDDGKLLGLAADDVPEQPTDVVLCESVRRFKGLERPVIVLLEVPRDDPDRLDRLLYIGASRATQHLVVIAPTAVLRRLERPN